MMKVTQTAGHGATVVLYGSIVDDAFAKARELALEKGFVFIHAFDDPQIIARGVMQEIEHPRLGNMRTTRNPVLLDQARADLELNSVPCGIDKIPFRGGHIITVDDLVEPLAGGLTLVLRH